MIGMFSAAENHERLARIERELEKSGLTERERGELEEARDELRGWFMDHWRYEGRA